MESSEYLTYTVKRLKIELAKRGAVLTGRKSDLIERLEAYERNNNFMGGIPIILPDEVITDWPTSGFHQLTKQHQSIVPKITDELVEGYFQYRMAMDHQSIGDLKALTKGQLLFETNRVEACSLNMTDNSVFFTGMVRAAMKKKISYSYRLILNSRSSDITNSHCECPAGKGPHGTCKHLAAVCMMLIMFTKTGNIGVDMTCTENLQTFHRPKSKHQGSPVKVENLLSKASVLLDDPRPTNYRNQPGYNDHVKNLILNYCGNTSKDISMRYLYSRADLQQAGKDHDYLNLPLTEQLVVNSNDLNVSEASEIEIRTRKQSKSQEWHNERANRITASRFGEIINMTMRRDRLKLCESIYIAKPLCNPAVNHGKLYEHRAIKQFEDTFCKTVKKCGLYILPSIPYLGASPDGLTMEGSLIEVKCPYTGRNSVITCSDQFPFLKLSDGKMVLKENHKYYAQIQGQLHICGLNECAFVVWTFVDMFVQQICYDEEYCTGSLLPKLELFYENYYRKYVASKL